jgi:2-oxoglutarate ferredoxin oxidoreductase subunit delta
MKKEGVMQKKKACSEQDKSQQEEQLQEPAGDDGPTSPADPQDDPEKGYLDSRKSPEKPLYSVIFFYEWCKSCGICSALCPQKIILQDETGKPSIEDMDSCTGCRFCEVHCPDFAITVKERYPDRRRKKNGSK